MAPSPRWLATEFGVRLVGRVAEASGTSRVCAGGEIVPFNDLTVIWCTGFRADFGFVRVRCPKRVFDAHGPVHKRGAVPNAPGLFFVGLKFQHTLSSQLIYGVGRDAQYIADRIHDYLGT